MARRKLNRLEIALLIGPALLLLGWGIFLHHRNAPGPDSQAQFKLAVDQAKFKVLPNSLTRRSSPFPHMKLVQVTISIGHHGPKPSWWGTEVNASNEFVQFIGKGENSGSQQDKDGGHGATYYGLNYDKERQQYVQVCKVEVPARPGFLDQSNCKIEVTLETQTQPPTQLASAQAIIPVQQIK